MAPAITKNESHFKQSLQAYLNDPTSSRDKVVADLTLPISDLFKTAGAEATEADLWTLWRTIITSAAQSTETEGASHDIADRLVFLVKDIKDLGPLSTQSGEAPKVADTWSGRLWTDLPFLGPALRECWNDAPPTTDAAAWASVNMFVARLVAADVHDTSLYAIWTLREALETPRPLTPRDEQQAPKSTRDVSLDELLPAALAWIEGCGDQLVKFCIEGKSFGSAPDPSKLGPMASSGETGAEEEGLASSGTTGENKLVARVERTGFNIDRWLFWRSRLLAISEMRDAAGGREKVAKLAYQGLQKMKSWDSQVGL